MALQPGLRPPGDVEVLTRLAAAPSVASWAKATEVYTKYIITDTYAKAAQGTPPADAVKWADGELKKIYEG